MKGRKKDAPPAEAGTTATTPFFARFLEGQEPDEDAEAKVSARRGRAQATTKSGGSTKKSGGGRKSGAKKSAAKKSAGKKSGAAGKTTAAAKAVTLKYPSDNDEFVLYPYRIEAARLGPGSGRQTLKYPSDGDEDTSFAVTYVDRKDVPKTAQAQQRATEKFARVNITRPQKDILDAG
ncbi:MAG TPA: microviridin/marinostatin family tricyclic proteinase inhibitor [Pyrinomonadaceae bacterium]|jgi:hypothetical protein